jgi:protoheme IX farnesyltransferase
MIIRFPHTGARSYAAIDTVCLRCLRTLSLPALRTAGRAFSTSIPKPKPIARGISQQRLRAGYFLDNKSLRASRVNGRGSAVSSAAIGSSPPSTLAAESIGPSSSKPSSYISQDLPHRRRRKTRQDATAAAVDEVASTGSPPVDPALPPDAPSKLTTLSARLPVNSLRRQLSTLLALSKPRLSFMIVLTATSAYSLYPVPTLLSPAITDTPSLSALTLLFLTVGTGLSSASANALNMLYEPKWDAMMSRTRNRPLVRGLISRRGALLFAILSGAAGVSALYYGVNPTVAFLGGLNIFIYAGIYTPMKRVSAINTWVGAVVGLIPPLMGWAAAAGQSATGSGDWRELLFGERSVGGWLVASLLFAWQFPHFMALSWPIRFEYRDAGYKMLCWTNPARNGRVALRYSLLFFPICVALCYTGVTEWSFAVASVPVNAWLVREAYRFWKYEGLKGSARGLFWASVWHLPVVMVLAMVEKKGMWGRIWRAVVGEPELDDEDEWVEEDEDDLPASSKRIAVTLPSR